MKRFGQDDLTGVAERLEAMVGSMEVLKDMPEAEDRAATLRELQERLEALLQPKLLQVQVAVCQGAAGRRSDCNAAGNLDATITGRRSWCWCCISGARCTLNTRCSSSSSTDVVCWSAQLGAGDVAKPEHFFFFAVHHFFCLQYKINK